jgi:hypothetical protein
VRNLLLGFELFGRAKATAVQFSILERALELLGAVIRKASGMKPN